MALTPEQFDAARALLAAAPDVHAAATRLRRQLPALRTLVLDALDMRDETPSAQAGGRSIYLMSTDGHCWTVTRELAAAGALVLTEA
ncbi:hypothetical protein [Caldimonas tepidiphila]|uniref:hypothetical protein n=1 Tax=Caldimonas tepidiphila TaxID=2315841 RepID=UPI000E5A5E68|nr:hypothetical protein [Caldimonas tepidiphila]